MALVLAIMVMAPIVAERSLPIRAIVAIVVVAATRLAYLGPDRDDGREHRTMDVSQRWPAKNAPNKWNDCGDNNELEPEAQ